MNNLTFSSNDPSQGDSSLFSGCQPARFELDNVSWSPNKKKPLLKPVSLKINAGEFIAVVGPNGSGKTSLLRCLYRVNKPSTGKVLLDDKDIWLLSPRQCAQHIATVLQNSSSEFGLTVFEMVEIGLTPQSTHWNCSQNDREVIENSLKLLNVFDLADRSFDSLSGGERQRVMIARALVQCPDVLILDEPTNHLDIRHQLEVLALLATLPCTVIVALHDLSLASTYADRVLVMNKGQMAAFAPPHEVFTKQQIKSVFDVETLIDKHPITQRPRFSFYLHNQQD